MICSIEGCNRIINSKGLCKFHYDRQRKGIPLEAPFGNPKPARFCSVEGCENEHESKGYCKFHYDRQLRTEVPLDAPKFNKQLEAEWGSPEYFKEWRETNPDQWREVARRSHLKTKFGLTLEEYDQMVDDQNGVCFICGNPETSKDRSGNIRPLSIDHDHETG